MFKNGQALEHHRQNYDIFINRRCFKMRTKKEEILIAKNIFKTENFDARKQAFNKHYENYINFCENKL